MTDQLIAGYLGTLDAAAWVLPAGRRAELVDEIRTHIDEALTQAGTRDEVTVRNVLERLGPPAEIVRASGTPEVQAAVRADWSPRGIGPEIAAVILLLIGGVVLPFIGWFVGLALLIASARWTVTDKVLGALVWPFGFAWVWLLPWAIFTSADSCGYSSDPVVTGSAPAERAPTSAPTSVIETLAPGTAADTACGTSGSGLIATVLFIVAVIAPVGVAAYLISRARRSAAQEDR